MYIPAAFAETDLTKLHDFIEQNSFGLLVSQVDGLPFATHLPFLLERTAGPHGTLVGHMARANPQWREAGGQTALAIFSGPHAYISPTWYEAEQVVPTWNYTAVHAYGRVQIIEDEDALLDIVQRSVRVYEQAMPRPWSFDGSEYLREADAGADRRLPHRDREDRGQVEAEPEPPRRAPQEGRPGLAASGATKMPRPSPP